MQGLPSVLDAAGSDSAAGPVVAIVDAALHEARARDRADLVARLEAERRRALRGSCAVLVVGEFNQGKSSLVNALLNVRVCATDADVATAVPTLVRYGPELTAATGDADGGRPTPVDPAEVEALETADDRSGPRGDMVEMTVPRALLESGLVLVDTPGMGGGLASAHAGRTLRALAGADAVVFVTDASQEITAAELELLRRIVSISTRVVFALTKIDVYPEWRRIRDIDRAHLERAGLTIPILPMSSTLRHQGLRSGDRALIADSGYPQLAAFLRATSGGAAQRSRAAAAAAAHSALSQLVSLVATEREALAEPGRQREHVEAVRLAQRRAEELRGGGSRWIQLLNDRIGDLSSAVDFDLGTRLRAVRKEAVERLGSADPAREWVDLEPWLYERTNSALAEHLRVLRDQADEIADEVARRFGEEAWRLRAETDITRVTARDTSATSDVGLAALAASRASRVELGIAALRGGSTGAVLTNAAGLLVFGAVMPAVFPVAALLAGILARMTWRTARTAQLRGLRAEAERAIAIYLEEVDSRARRDTRDSVRRIHQHLRDVFSGHAAELQSSMQRNLEVLAQGVRDDQRSRDDRLKKVDAELERLRSLAARAEKMVDELLSAGRPVPPR
jgi:GTP-binding protein EngB required for normal cell division